MSSDKKTLTPASEAELIACVQQALSTKTALTIQGGDTRLEAGYQETAAQILSTRHLAGITLLQPEEMVFSAKSGTAVADIEATLAQHGQRLGFEPMNLSYLLKRTGQPTIGGIVAGNMAGPRRVYAGGVRDHLLGVRFVNGFGKLITSGGRVMKNVTGLDLVKLMAGSWGTLGPISEVTFKVVPQAEASASIAIYGLSDHDALTLLGQVLASPYEVSGVAHLPVSITGETSQTLLRFEGFPSQLAYRLEQICKLSRPFGRHEKISDDDSLTLWQSIRDVKPLAEPDDWPIWKISLPTSQAADFVKMFAQKHNVKAYYDWGGSRIWLAIDPTSKQDFGAQDFGAQALHTHLPTFGGHATLVRGASALSEPEIFPPLPDALSKLSAKIKQAFDPDSIFNPGLMRLEF